MRFLILLILVGVSTIASAQWWTVPTAPVSAIEQYSSVKNRMAFNGSSSSTALSQLISYYSTRGGSIVIDTVVTVSSSVSISSDVEFKEGGQIVHGANTVTISGNMEAPKRQHLFSGTGQVTLSKKVSTLYPYWWGAKGDGTGDDIIPIQACVNSAWLSSSLVIQLLSGDHPISKGILLANPAGWLSISLTFRGIENYDGNTGTQIRCLHNDNFAIAIQNGRSMTIENIYFRGLGSSYNPTMAQIINNIDDDWASQYGRKSRYSPFSAIVIDPFSSVAPPDGGYPNFSSSYTAGQAGSSNISIKNVVCRYFIVGVMFTPHGTFGNGSEVSMSRVLVDRCKEGVAIGFTQNRSIAMTDCNIASVKTCMDSNTYGFQAGPMPSPVNCQFGSCKSILNVNGNYGELHITNSYGESIYQIGYVSGENQVLNFTNCAFNFTTHNETGVQDASGVLTYNGITQFNGGSMAFSSYRPTCINVTKLVLNAVSLNQPVVNTPNTSNTTYQVIYNDCKVSGYLNQDGFNITSTGFTEQVNSSVVSGYGMGMGGTSFEYPETGQPLNTIRIENKPASAWLIDFRETATISINTATSQATFTAADGGRYKLGDILVSPGQLPSADNPSGLSLETCLGIVTDITSNVITCSFVSRGITAGSKPIYNYRLRKYRPCVLATTTTGSNQITVTSFSTQETVAQLYPAGARVHGAGIKSGSHVTAVTGNVLTISTNCTASGTGIEVYDAICRGTFRSFDNQFPETGSTFRTFGARTGDQLIFENHPYRSGGIATSGGYTPAWKFSFKPISGTTAQRPTPTTLDVGLEYYNTTISAFQKWNGTTWN